MSFARIPLTLPGRLFASCMPFHRDLDPMGGVHRAYRRERVDAVVVLVSSEECHRLAGRDLLGRYREDGFEVIHLPMPDYGTPLPDELAQCVRQAEAQLRAGRNVAVHCAYGIGRTGMFLAALAGHVLGMTGPDALAWVRRWRPGAAETEEQEDTVSDTLTILAADGSPDHEPV